MHNRVLEASFPGDVASKEAMHIPAYLEYGWYAVLAYAMVGTAWGMVIPAMGKVSLVALAAACFLAVGSQASRVYAPVRWAFGAGISVVLISYVFHSEASLEESYGYVEWVCNLLIAQTLLLRPGFLHRFAWAAFGIGVSVMPFIVGRPDGALTRIGAAGTALSNANALAVWFGFSTVYFLFMAVQTRQAVKRGVYGVLVLGCLFMVANTVSRSAILAIVVACIMGFHSILKRHFLPLLSMMILLWGTYESGVFDALIDQYVARGTKDTGRAVVWPIALDRFLNEPWIGVGFDNIKIPYGRKIIYPHNGLFQIALGAGVVPLICFLAYLARAATGTYRIIQMGGVGDYMMVPPLVTFAVLELMVSDRVFMSPWVVVALALTESRRGIRNPLSSREFPP